MDKVQTMLLILQLVLAIGNIAIIGYGFYKFLNRPHDEIKRGLQDAKKTLKISSSRFTGEMEDSRSLIEHLKLLSQQQGLL